MYLKKKKSCYNHESYFFCFQFRKMFLGLSQSTCTSMAPDPDDEVLVADSDEEHI